jgi:periplasmic protein CpxP/Spy
MFNMNNITNNRWLSVITLLLLTANIVTLALLWTNKSNNATDIKHPPPGGQVFEFLSRELNLTTAQKEAYRKLRDEHQAGVRPLHDSIRMAKDNFFALLQKENSADSLIQEYSKKTGELEQRLDVFTFRHFQKLRKICNAEQQQIFDNIIQEALHRMAGPKRPPGPPHE